ncbi:hypothetical protein [Streptomyces niveus]|uniref:hypothetical protein n=1 Tax=Streptomyces niveus TaxID=193462 RepID=UPI00365DA2A6
MLGVELATIADAQGQLLERCMEQAGFRYWVPPALSAEESRDFGFVIDDVAWAKTYGYGGRIQQKARGHAAINRNQDYVKSLSKDERARYSTALQGNGQMLSVTLPDGRTIRNATGGCEAKGEQRLYGDREAWFRASRVTDHLGTLYMPKVEADPRFKRAVSAWSACMRASGFTYKDPREIRSDLPGLTAGLRPDEAHSLEVRTAVAEATCARQTSLAESARTVIRHHQDALPKHYRAEIDTRNQLRHGAYSMSRNIVSSQG